MKIALLLPFTRPLYSIYYCCRKYGHTKIEKRPKTDVSDGSNNRVVYKVSYSAPDMGGGRLESPAISRVPPAHTNETALLVTHESAPKSYGPGLFLYI